MWKNGQCVTINKKKYRVKSVKHRFLEIPCDYYCALNHNASADCDSICFSEESKLNGYQYLEEIPAKGKVLAK